MPGNENNSDSEFDNSFILIEPTEEDITKQLETARLAISDAATDLNYVRGLIERIDAQYRENLDKTKKGTLSATQLSAMVTRNEKIQQLIKDYNARVEQFNETNNNPGDPLPLYSYRRRYNTPVAKEGLKPTTAIAVPDKPISEIVESFELIGTGELKESVVVDLVDELGSDDDQEKITNQLKEATSALSTVTPDLKLVRALLEEIKMELSLLDAKFLEIFDKTKNGALSVEQHAAVVRRNKNILQLIDAYNKLISQFNEKIKDETGKLSKYSYSKRYGMSVDEEIERLKPMTAVTMVNELSPEVDKKPFDEKMKEVSALLEPKNDDDDDNTISDKDLMSAAKLLQALQSEYLAHNSAFTTALSQAQGSVMSASNRDSFYEQNELLNKQYHNLNRLILKLQNLWPIDQRSPEMLQIRNDIILTPHRDTSQIEEQLSELTVTKSPQSIYEDAFNEAKRIYERARTELMLAEAELKKADSILQEKLNSAKSQSVELGFFGVGQKTREAARSEHAKVVARVQVAKKNEIAALKKLESLSAPEPKATNSEANTSTSPKK